MMGFSDVNDDRVSHDICNCDGKMKRKEAELLAQYKLYKECRDYWYKKDESLLRENERLKGVIEELKAKLDPDKLFDVKHDEKASRDQAY